MKLKLPKKLHCRVDSPMWIDQQARLDGDARIEAGVKKLQKNRAEREIQTITT